MNIAAYTKKKRNEAKCFRFNEPDCYYEKGPTDEEEPEMDEYDRACKILGGGR